MKKSPLISSLLAVCMAVIFPFALAVARDDSSTRKPDLADIAQGHYFGDVISDSRGSSRSGVTLTITKVDKNRVRITSDYARLPEVEVGLTRAMATIVNANGSTAFVLDSTKNPAHLDVSILNEVSWSGEKQ